MQTSKEGGQERRQDASLTSPGRGRVVKVKHEGEGEGGYTMAMIYIHVCRRMSLFGGDAQCSICRGDGASYIIKA